MKIFVLSLIGAAAMFLTSGCESDEHGYGGEHRHYGGAYDGNYGTYGHEQGPGYPARGGSWERSDDWHPH